MTKQKPHVRISKKGKKFIAGQKKFKKFTFIYTKEIKILKSLFKTLSQQLLSINVQVSPYGTVMWSMDPANVSMFKVYPSIGFAGFRAAKKARFMFNVPTLWERIRDTDNSDALRIDIFSSIMRVQNITKGSTHTMPLMEYSEPSQIDQPKNLNFGSKLVISPKEFKRIVSEIAKVSEVLILYSDAKKSRVMSSEDDDSDFISALDTQFNKTEGKQKSKYSISYLKSLYAILPITKEIIVEFSSDSVLRLTFESIISNRQSMRVKYLLAPRVDAE
jgi:hypothetical protein